LLGCELPGTKVLVEPVQVLFPVLGLVAGLLGKRSPVLQEPVNARVIQNPTDRLLELFERTEGDGVAGLRLSIGEPGPDQGQEGGEDLLPVLLGEPDEVGVMELVVVAQMRVRSLRTEVDPANAALEGPLHAGGVSPRDPGWLVRNLDRVVAAKDPVGPGSSGQGSCKLLALDVVSLIEQEEVSATLE